MNRVRVRKIGSGAFVGSLTLGCPGADGVGDMGGEAVITVAGVGGSKADALHKAALIAEHITNDPIISALLPPQARAAIVATKKLASAAKQGSRVFRSVWRRFHGPGVQRLARALHDESMKAEGHTDAEVGAFWDRAKSIAKKAAKYGHPAGWAYMAAKYGAKKAGIRLRNPLVRARKRPEPQYDDEQYDDDDAQQAQQPAPQQAPEPAPEAPDIDDDADNEEEGA